MDLPYMIFLYLKQDARASGILISCLSSFVQNENQRLLTFICLAFTFSLAGHKRKLVLIPSWWN
jgi:hypothetical protein